MERPVKILVVDDDDDLRGLTAYALRQGGYVVVEARDGPEALAVHDRERPQVVILDVNMPGMSGFDVCRRLRARGSDARILMLTVRSSEEDEVIGLDLGADDYLTKPFSPKALLARVRAVLRRSGQEAAPALEVGDLSLDVERKAVSVRGGPPVTLTNLEFRLLQLLVSNAGRPVATERLATHVWGDRGVVGDKQLVKQLVHRLRQKIEIDPATPRYVLTASGVGYLCARPTPMKSGER